MKVQLKEICNIHGGIAAPKLEEAYSQEGIPFVRMKDLGQYHLTSNLIETNDSLNSDYALNNNIKIIPKGSIILPRSGSVSLNHRAVLGTDAIIVSHICALEVTSKKVNNLYLYYYLIVRNIDNIIKKTTGLDAVTFNDLGKLYVNIPTLEIQNYFVRSLQIIERIILKRQQTIDILNQLVKAFFLDMFGDPIQNKQKLKTIKLSEIGNWKSGGTPPRKEKHYYSGNLPWFSSGELNDIFISNSNERITIEAIEKTSAKLIEKGSILLGMYDTAALKSSITEVESSCNQAIAFCKLEKSKSNTIFVYYAIQLSKSYYLNARQGVRQKNLNLSKIKNIKILFPEKFQQDKFAQLAELIYRIKVNLQTSQNNLNTLFQSLLQKAFEGELEFEKEKILEDILPNLNVEELLTDIKLLKALLGKLQKQDFKTGSNYKMAQNLLFQLLDNENSGVYQQFDIETDKLETKHEAN